MNPEKIKGEAEKKRKSIQELWEESDRITQEIIKHPWKYPLQYLMMLLGRMPDKKSKQK